LEGLLLLFRLIKSSNLIPSSLLKPFFHSNKSSSCKHIYQRVYYCSVLRLALRLTPIFLPPMMTSSVLLDNYLNHNPFTSFFTLKNLFIVPLLFYPIVVLAAYFYSRNFPVKVISKGIYGRDYKKQKVFLTWQEISYKGITYRNLLPYHQLKSKLSRQEVLIPTFLKDIKKLYTQLKEHNIIIGNQNSVIKANVNNITNLAKPRFEPLRERGYIIVTTERNH
jgi:hypothetical protein